jgi:iron complex transport system permease protein
LASPVSATTSLLRNSALGTLALGALALGAMVLSITAGIAIGAVSIPFDVVWAILIRKALLALSHVLPWAGDAAAAIDVNWSAGRESIVWTMRFPRAILAALVGAGLAVVGAVLQSLTRNPLADPHLLGVSSGAALGAIIALLHTGLILGLATVPLFAFLGALAATALVMGVAQATRANTADRLVLSGVAVSFIISALGSLLVFLGDPRAVHTVVFWMLGGFGLAQWSQLAYPAVVLAGAMLFFMWRARELNALAMGDETALTLGIPVRRFRLSLFFATALLTGVMVAFSGAIGFIGLMVPHLGRMIIGSDNQRLIPLSALIGAIALIWADIAGRTLIAPEDLPIGIVTGLIGGLAFLIMLFRK